MSVNNPAQTGVGTKSQLDRTAPSPQKITTFLWFNDNAEEAANFYVSLFKNSRIINAVPHVEGVPGPKASVLTIEFELDGQRFTGLNGGPQFKFTEAISLWFTVKLRRRLITSGRNFRKVGKKWNVAG